VDGSKKIYDFPLDSSEVEVADFVRASDRILPFDKYTEKPEFADKIKKIRGITSTDLLCSAAAQPARWSTVSKTHVSPEKNPNQKYTFYQHTETVP
jgi:hypothetical protein